MVLEPAEEWGHMLQAKEEEKNTCYEVAGVL